MPSTPDGREIRLATPGDAPGILAIYAPVVASTAISFELEAPTVAEMAGRIERVLPAHPWIVLTDGAKVLGYAHAQPWLARVDTRGRAPTRGNQRGAEQRCEMRVSGTSPRRRTSPARSGCRS